MQTHTPPHLTPSLCSHSISVLGYNCICPATFDCELLEDRTGSVLVLGTILWVIEYQYTVAESMREGVGSVTDHSNRCILEEGSEDRSCKGLVIATQTSSW